MREAGAKSNVDEGWGGLRQIWASGNDRPGG